MRISDIELPKSGFSLVELSIVLVILGLLTGGILAGQSLIRAAELRSVSTDLARYTAAVHTFRDKYFAIPGDMSTATKFWGAQDGTTGNTAACRTTASTTALTCNGNGDGFIWSMDSAVTYSEVHRFWQHLANAGLIEGTYTGIGNGGVYVFTPGTNSPRSRLSNSGWAMQAIGTVPTGTVYAGSYGNAFYFGVTAPSGPPDGFALKAEEMWNIDTKLDDGKPAYGSITSYVSSARPNCSTTDVPSTAEYVLTATAAGCNMVIKSGF